jgi:hypothetical protein
MEEPLEDFHTAGLCEIEIMAVGCEDQGEASLCERCQQIEFRPECTVNIGGHMTKGIRDTGATISVVKASLIPRASYLKKRAKVRFADVKDGICAPIARIHMESPYFKGEAEVLVLENPSYPVLIGNSRTTRKRDSDRISVYPIKEDCARVETRASNKVSRVPAKVTLPRRRVHTINRQKLKAAQDADASMAKIRARCNPDKTWMLTTLRRVVAFLAILACAFIITAPTNCMGAGISTSGNDRGFSSVHLKQYPTRQEVKDIVHKEIQEMIMMGVIEPGVSEYSAPIVLVKKKDGTTRFCIDYRKLNNSLLSDSEQMPDVDALFGKLSKAKYFSKLDLSKGYWQIPVQEEDRKKTAFSTPFGQFQWKTMPFGLKTAGAIFTRMMRKLLLPLERDDIDNFIDDILVASETWEDHVIALEAVMKRLIEANLTAKPSKCYFGFSELSYLGHLVGKGKIKPEDDKVEKLRKAERPTTKTEVRAFLGLAGYYRKFVKNFSELAHPLTELTKGKQPEKVKWSVEAEKAFSDLKEHLCCKPVMCLPDKNKEFILRTDASNQAVGAVLLQDHGDGPQPVAYASRKLKDAEKNYATIEKECLASIWAIKKFEPYLYGKSFVLETDHQPLHYLEKSKTENGRLMRWALTLQQYDFRVHVIKGKDNIGADYLSRSFATKE